MQCKDVAVVLEREGFVPVPETARAHLSACPSCQSLVADLTAIVATAHLLPAEVDPPGRVWVSLRSQLEEEGIIRSAAQHGSWWHAWSELFRTRVLATSGVALIIFAAVILQTRHPVEPTQTEARTAYRIYNDTSVVLSNDEARLPAVQFANASGVDVSLRQNLDIVDRFIADCEQRMKAEPQDDLAREYLSGAYQQKAELLSVMMEREGERELK
jgi:hypothetical protein